MPTDQELVDQVEDWKKKGNDAFSKNDLNTAISHYSQGIVQFDRLIAPKVLLKATILSNRAFCFLKLGRLGECVEDCDKAMGLLEIDNDTKLRGKVLYRRAKALYLRANIPFQKKEDDLQLAAKDLLNLISFDPANKDANQLLQTIRAQHAVETKNNVSNSPLFKTLEAVKKHDDKTLHNTKVLMGMITNDPISASMELGRLGGVKSLFEIADDGTKDIKLRSLCLQILAASGSHPPFTRSFLAKDIQTRLRDIAIKSCQIPEEDDLVIGALSIFLRLILHLDRDDPTKEIVGKTLLEYDCLTEALIAAFSSHNVKIVRAALDILSSWTAGTNRENIIRAALDDYVDLPIPKTKQEQKQMKPKEISDYKQRLYHKRTRDEAWAFERANYFFDKGGLQTLMECGRECAEFTLRKEVTVTLGRVLAALDSDERIQAAVGPIFGYKPKKKEVEKKEDDKLGVVIEELDDDDDDEVGKVTDVKEGSSTEANDDASQTPVTLEKKIERALLSSSLLLAKPEVGGWSLGTGWPTREKDLKDLVDSDEKAALVVVSELVSSASSVKETRPMVAVLLDNSSLKQLVTHKDPDIRTAAASAITKLGMAEQETDDVEIIGLLEAACYMLEDKESPSESQELISSKALGAKSTATTSIERGVEVMNYLVSKTMVKDEIAAGFKATKESKQTGLESLVSIADMPDAGASLTAYGLASIFQLMAVTGLKLREESFEGKEITMEQYDEIQKMQKTEEEKEMAPPEDYTDDSDEQCEKRIQQMVAANVPRALVQLTQGASEKTLEQIVLALSRMASIDSVRGTMIQQGVLSSLIKIEKEEKMPSETKKKILRLLRQTIGKMLISTNPSLLTSSQKMGSIKPLISLVRDIDSKDLEKFEALLALTNLAASGDDAKARIIAEQGISTLHFAMFSDHAMVKKAATENMVNLVPHEEMLKHLRKFDNCRLWLALASDFEDNFECARAAAGGLAMSTQDPEIARQMIKNEKFKERFDSILQCGNLEMMHRILVVILNLAEGGGELKEAVVEHGLLAFCIAYVESYHSGTKSAELGFSDQDMSLFNVTVDLARQVAKACE